MALANESFSCNQDYFCVVVFQTIILRSLALLLVSVGRVRMVEMIPLEPLIIEMETFSTPDATDLDTLLVKDFTTFLTFVKSALLFARLVKLRAAARMSAVGQLNRRHIAVLTPLIRQKARLAAITPS